MPLIDGDDGEVRGVVNVECAEPLTPAHHRRVELAAYLFQKLHSFYQSKVPESDRRLIDQLVDHGHPVRMFQRACKLFCQWAAAKEQLNADLTYVLIYDPRVRIFRPHGITLSRELALGFLGNRKEGENFGRDRIDPEWVRQYEADKTGLIHGLVEHMAGARLLPKLRGRTWGVFTRQEPPCYLRELKDEGDAFSRSRAQYIQAGVGLPFYHDRRAQADGVLWVSWGKDTGDAGSRSRRRSRLCRGSRAAAQPRPGSRGRRLRPAPLLRPRRRRRPAALSVLMRRRGGPPCRRPPNCATSWPCT